MSYIYLLQIREFINLKLPIFKVGKTTKSDLSRINSYPKQSELIFYIKCKDCHNCEKIILEIFNNKFKLVKSVGNEYFLGDEKLMISYIIEILKTYDNLKDYKINLDKNNNINDNLLKKYINSSNIELLKKYNLIDDNYKIIVDSNNSDKVIINTSNKINDDNKIDDNKINDDKIDDDKIDNNKTNDYKIDNNKTDDNDKLCEVEMYKVLEYKCEKCNLTYKTTNGLWKHNNKYHKNEKKQDDGKPFKCKYCNTTFTRKNNMNMHIKNICKEKNNEIQSLKNKIEFLTYKLKNKK